MAEGARRGREGILPAPSPKSHPWQRNQHWIRGKSLSFNPGILGTGHVTLGCHHLLCEGSERLGFFAGEEIGKTQKT
jgi:hypothetical protein